MFPTVEAGSIERIEAVEMQMGVNIEIFQSFYFEDLFLFLAPSLSNDNENDYADDDDDDDDDDD